MIHVPFLARQRATRRAVLSASAVAPAVGLLAACTGGGDESGPEPGVTGEPVAVRVATGAFFNSWEAYLYAGQDLGRWEEAGFQVEVVPGAGTGANLGLLAGGEVEFAALDVNAAIIEWEAGSFQDAVLTCVLHRNLLGCVLAPESSGVEALRDLEGRTVGVLEGGVNTVVFPALAELARFDVDNVEQVALDLPFFPHYQSGTIDAGLEFLPSRAEVEQVLGEPVWVQSYSEHLPELYGSGVGVSRELVEQQPDMVRRFNQVSIDLLKWSVDNPDEAAGMYVARHEDDDPEVIARGLRDLEPYVRPDPGLELGQFSQDRLFESIAVLTSLRVLGDSPRLGDDLGQLFAFDLYR